MKYYYITLIASLFFIFNGTTQEFNTEKLDSFFQALEDNNRFMGSVAISKEGEIIYEKSLGYVDLEKEITPNNTTKYRVGSISKTFTATLVFMAIEEKKLKLKTSLKKYYPEIVNAKKITIEQLLYHRTGISNFTNREDYLNWNTEAKTEKEMLDIILDSGNDFEPDEKFQYSNSNYLLLSYILEKIYNQPFSEILEEKIILPLGLKDTYAGGKIKVEENEALSYIYTNKWKKEEETDASVPIGAGAIVSTPIELITFIEALFNGELIKEANLEKMMTLKEGFGMGMFMLPFYDKMGWGHTGGIDGFSSVFAYIPKEKIGFALTSNGSNFNNNDISIAMLSTVFDKKYDIPEFMSYEVTEEEIITYLGEYENKEYEIEIEFSNEEGVLMGFIPNQTSIYFQAIDKNIFENQQFGLKIEFVTKEKKMILHQSGQKITLKKK